MENDIRLIKQFNQIDGQYRNPSSTEDGLNIQWNNTTGYFDYVPDIHIISAVKDTATNRAKLTMSDDSVIYLELGALAWASSVSDPEVGGNLVESVFGRTGAITPQDGDYNASQVTNAFNTATQSLDDITEGTTNLHYTQADVDVIQGLVDDTHTHANKAVLDGITDSGGGVIPSALQIATWDGYATLTDQQIRDVVAAMITDGTGISFVYNGTTLVPTVTLEPFTADQLASGETNTYYSTTQVSNVKTIKLPAGASVVDRIASPIEVPLDWVMAVGTSSVDLLVTHNLTREIAYVLVWSEETTGKVLLERNLAYSGLTAPDDNSILIKSLSTVAFPITIELIFA
jgi:hypothetical protein